MFVSLGGQFRSSLAAGIAIRLLLKISLFVRSLSTNKNHKFARSALLQLSPQCTVSVITTVHCFSYHHSALHHLILVFLQSSYYNKPAYSTPKELCWKFRLSILKCPARAWTSIPLEPAARSPPPYLTSNILLGIKQQPEGHYLYLTTQRVRENVRQLMNFVHQNL